MTDGDRPRLHLTPAAGWMNDPNGLIFNDGVLHAFYQHEPDALRWGRMRWGHAVSRDLITWEHLPIALEPDDGGVDDFGCWSGCTVIDDDGVPTIFYTGVVLRAGVRRASICAATSSDGLTTWAKLGRPVIEGPPARIRANQFRDPFVWRDGGGWAMLVGAGTGDARGAVLIYRSRDLRTWRYHGPFLTTGDVVAADPAVVVDDIDSPCWECPQLLRFGEFDALVVSIEDRAPKVRPAHVVAFVGRMEGDRFLVRHADRVGLGPDFYAPAATTAPDGRALLFGWIPEDPPSRSSHRTWAGSLTLPRVASLDDASRFRISLADEVEQAAGPGLRLADAAIADGSPWHRAFRAPRLELRMTLVPDHAASVRIDIATHASPLAEVRFDPRDRRVTIVRTGNVRVAGRDPHGTAILPPLPGGRLRLRLILDGSILELAANDLVTATARLPAAHGETRTVSVAAIGGGCHVRDLTASTFGEPLPDQS